MNAPRENPRSRGGRDPNGQRGERGRSAPRGERGANDGQGRPKRHGDPPPERERPKDRGSSRRDESGPRGGKSARDARRGAGPAPKGGDGNKSAESGPRGGKSARDARRGAGPAPKGGDGNKSAESGPRGGKSARDARRGAGPAPKGGDGNKSAESKRAPKGARADRQAENRLSAAARERLEALRADYEPGDEQLPDDRDTYPNVPGGIRLQKALAQSGVASRRASEEMIAAGRVSVDGHMVRRFGARVDPETSVIRVDGLRVATAPGLLYYALNKPRGVISTMWDPEGRRALADYTGETEERLFHVGRLDTETEGLILLTNDGELANRLTHPRYKVAKTYVAKVPGPVPRGVVSRVRKGVELDDGKVKVDAFRVTENLDPKALVEVTLHEGRKHIVRRLLEAVGHPVDELARTQVGPVGLNSLKPGTMRVLTAKEVSELYGAAEM